MTTKKYWESSIIEFTKLVKEEKTKRNIGLLGSSFEIFPNVFSPIHSSDTAWFAKKIIPLVGGKKILEIGSGSGVIACLAAIHGATSVVATDINPDAINNILSNAKLHSLNISIRIGNVFDPILKHELFDIIFWNHPFYFSTKKANKDDFISLSVYDQKYHSLKEFFINGKLHLEKNGQLLLGTSNIARINLIKKFARDYKYKTCLLEKTEVPVFKEKKVKMDLRLYSFRSL